MVHSYHEAAEGDCTIDSVFFPYYSVVLNFVRCRKLYRGNQIQLSASWSKSFLKILMELRIYQEDGCFTDLCLFKGFCLCYLTWTCFHECNNVTAAGIMAHLSKKNNKTKCSNFKLDRTEGTLQRKQLIKKTLFRQFWWSSGLPGGQLRYSKICCCIDDEVNMEH